MNILEQLGLDADRLVWDDFARCKNIVSVTHHEDGSRTVYNPMFDDYEEDVAPFVVRKAVDAMCLSCPVAQQCYSTGTLAGESGVWGGIYLNEGSIDAIRNEHKTEHVWDQLGKKLGGF